MSSDLHELARTAEAAADLARRETLPRFRSVATEWKADGSPVTEADRAAERVIRATLLEAHPDIGIVGEEYGAEGERAERHWLVDPIDGTIAYSRGIPLYTTLIALMEGDEPVLGLIDLPALGERYVGWRGGGCRCNGEPVRVSAETELARTVVAHGDRDAFDAVGEGAYYERLARELPRLRGYTDGFGHAMVLRGAAGAMVDFCLHDWDAAAPRILVTEAGGACAVLPQGEGRVGLVCGGPALVEQLLALRGEAGA